MNPLKHVAIIMDGNGRWGLKNKNSSPNIDIFTKGNKIEADSLSSKSIDIWNKFKLMIVFQWKHLPLRRKSLTTQ